MSLLGISLPFFRTKIAEPISRPQPDKKLVQRWVEKHGDDSNSFLTLYDGFEYFKPKNAQLEGTIAFVDTQNAWIAATPPLAQANNRLEILEEFKKAAADQGKSVMMLPVDESFARQARALGFDAIMIGSEPLFDLTRYIPDLGQFHSAKRLQSDGATVTCYRIENLASEKRIECEEILRDWFDNRWMSPLQFLNRVNPWELASYKRYLLLEHDGQILGFLAAVPVLPNKGWYCVDLIRRVDAPPGSTEMLVLEAMKILRAEGAEWISLGVSPLSRIDLAPKTEHPALYRFLAFIYDNANTFYRFKPLFEFKRKFSPTSYPPRFMILYPGRMRLPVLLSLLNAFVPGGMFGAIESAILRRLRHVHLQDWLDRHLRTDLVVRGLPEHLLEFFSRIPVTLIVAATSIALYSINGPEWREAYAFSWSHLLATPLHALILPAFLHENVTHLVLNLTLAFTGVAASELLLGSLMTAGIFLGAALFANPLTLFSLGPIMAHEQWMLLDDVGASLGIFGCWGAFIYLFSKRRMLILGITLGIVAVSVLDHNPMSMNHAFAFWIGFAIVRSIFGRDAARYRL